MTAASIRDTANRWLIAEPDDDIRAQLVALLDGPEEDLNERFSGSLGFGTAGIRAAIGAGPLRMNRLVVRQVAAGLGHFLLENDPAVASRGVLIGYDGRRKSDLFATDTARVMAALGIRAMLFDRTVATPVLAWSITEFGAAAGVMVTASHNPAADNGYKVYLGDGAQISSPDDNRLSASIELIDPTCVALSDTDSPLITSLDDTVAAKYLEHVATVRFNRSANDVKVAYTPMHGVGGDYLVRAFEMAGLPVPAVVAEQFEPDAMFSTVPFPNPEEPGAMDLVISLAQLIGADVALANDPDADRLGVAIPLRSGSWRQLGGDEIGWLFADYVLQNTSGTDRLVVSTLVSSALLGKMAEFHGVRYIETFTGFKWIARAALDHPDLRLVFAYEQALGYLVAERPLDKDGISAAVLFAEMVAAAANEGRTMENWLDDIASRYGRHLLADSSIAMSGADAGAYVAALSAQPPRHILGRAVLDCQPIPAAGLLRLELAGGVRVQVRPSGTEPKVKLYAEAIGEDPAPYLVALETLLLA